MALATHSPKVYQPRRHIIINDATGSFEPADRFESAAHMSSTTTWTPPRLFEPIAKTWVDELELADNEQDFLHIAEKQDWLSFSPVSIVDGIRWALKAGAHLFAQKLALEGSQKYPGHQQLQYYARVLAPSRLVRKDIPPSEGLAGNRAWLKENRQKYAGQWVALQNGRLLGMTDSLKSLRDQVPPNQDIYFIKV